MSVGMVWADHDPPSFELLEAFEGAFLYFYSGITQGELHIKRKVDLGPPEQEGPVKWGFEIEHGLGTRCMSWLALM